MMVMQSVEVINSRAEDVFSEVLDCVRALCFGQTRLVAPKLEAGISFDDRQASAKTLFDSWGIFTA